MSPVEEYISVAALDLEIPSTTTSTLVCNYCKMQIHYKCTKLSSFCIVFCIVTLVVYCPTC